MSWWQYLVLVNLYLVLFYGFYVLLLKRETFFQLNRIYLVSAALLSFLIPLIHSEWVKGMVITQKMQYSIYSSPVMIYNVKSPPDTHITAGQALTIVYLAGIAVLAGRMIWQLIGLRKIINKPGPSAAYSFFKRISLGDNLINNDVIAAHEHVHARQWHSFDVLCIEVIMIINWFNPVVYFYRLAIKHIHEFIADRQAVKTGTNKTDYALLLLSQTFNAPAHQLVNPFYNNSLLKQRIMMLNKNNSQRMALIKYGLSAPLFILMLILSSATVNNSRTIRLFNHQAEQALLPAAPENAGEKNRPQQEIRLTDRRVINGTGKHGQLKTTLIIVQNDTTRKQGGTDVVFTSVEEVPEFPGGLEAFMNYLAKSIKYPAAARKNHTQGRVIVSFIVEKDGSLSDVHIARGIGDGTDEEALRVINASPKWKPGFQNGKPVRVSYTVPIAFVLDDVKPARKENKTGAVINTGSGSVTGSDNRMVTLQLSDPQHPPLYLLDGKEIASLGMVQPNDIQSVSVLKEKAATSLYGEKGKNGVVVIVTKKAKVKQAPVN